MSERENRSGRHTKAWILETACQLFNEHGTAAVSTKRIAKAMGISPGNLYYHFKNKEEIILALFHRNKGAFGDDLADRAVPPLQRLRDVSRGVVMMWQDCRFFEKEMVLLIDNDPQLRQSYRELSADMYAKASGLFRELIEGGFITIERFSPERFDALLNISMLIANHWLTHLDTNGIEITMDTLQQGADLILLVWRPYLTDAAIAQLDALDQQHA